MSQNTALLPVALLYNLDRTWDADEIREIQGLASQLETALLEVGHSVRTLCLENEDIEEAMYDCDPGNVVVFNWCEEIPGVPNSSYLITRKLDEMGFAYTGADTKALLLSHDKPAVKKRLRRRHVPTPGWHVYITSECRGWEQFPAIVKPAFEHSSIGITHDAVVSNPEELSHRLEEVINTYHQPALVEDFIDGREFHVSVIGNGKLEVLPIAEMDFSAIGENNGRLCTYDSKFIPNSTDYQMIQLKLPAPLDPEQQRTLESVAVTAYKATDCRDYARLDIRLRGDTFYVLDVNPNADLSPDTSLMLSAEMAGYSLGRFGSRLVELASHRLPVPIQLTGIRKEKEMELITPDKSISNKNK